MMKFHYYDSVQAQALQRAALRVAQAHSPEDVVAQIVADLAQEPGVALARIWLMRPGDQCQRCPMRSHCHDQTKCLHLVASATDKNPNASTSPREGSRFRRFPLGVRKVGEVGATGEPRLLHVSDEHDWLADPRWAREAKIVCFAGQPLTFRGETLGVLAVFSRENFSDEAFGWLRTFADHAATSLATRRAFQEVEDLRAQLELERDYLREEIREMQAHGQIVGTSAAIQQVLQQVELVARSNATVMIEGESGTGKELIAVAVHEQSGRSKAPLVRVNCASIPRELFESEFFGHQRGSFTGATRDRAGRFQVADGGTLFLDEVGEIPLELQGKLLRALQEGKFSRIGEDQERKVDVRIVAATNRDLLAEVRAGRFREDLYYRLSVFPIRVPPLRERPQDIALLAQHFVTLGFSGPAAKRPKLTDKHVKILQSYDWPGNVRELQNVVQRALISGVKGRLELRLPRATSETKPKPEPRPLMTQEQLRELERDNLVAVLDHTHWKISGEGGAAAFLGMHPATLNSRLKTMGIKRPRKTTQ